MRYSLIWSSAFFVPCFKTKLLEKRIILYEKRLGFYSTPNYLCMARLVAVQEIVANLKANQLSKRSNQRIS